jgi:hypothetical protein
LDFDKVNSVLQINEGYNGEMLLSHNVAFQCVVTVFVSNDERFKRAMHGNKKNT